MSKEAINYVKRRLKWLRDLAKEILRHSKTAKNPLFEGWYWDIVAYTNEIEKKLKVL